MIKDGPMGIALGCSVIMRNVLVYVSVLVGVCSSRVGGCCGWWK